jgi:pyridoxine kinase
MNVLSVQSQVAYGRVGNRAAGFALERMGHEVWPVATASFSNHPGLGAPAGGVLGAGELAAMLGALEARGAFSRCDAVLAGYLGSAANGRVLLEAVKRIKEAAPRCLFALDPVLGEREKGVYVAPDLADFYRREALPLADMIFPNEYELELLAGRPIAGRADAIRAARDLLDRGPALAAVTGWPSGERAMDMVITPYAAYGCAPPRLAVAASGAGDLFAALFVGAYLSGSDGTGALSHASAATHYVLAETARRGGDSLAVVEAQDDLARPRDFFTLVPLEARPD